MLTALSYRLVLKCTRLSTSLHNLQSSHLTHMHSQTHGIRLMLEYSYLYHVPYGLSDMKSSVNWREDECGNKLEDCGADVLSHLIPTGMSVSVKTSSERDCCAHRGCLLWKSILYYVTSLCTLFLCLFSPNWSCPGPCNESLWYKRGLLWWLGAVRSGVHHCTDQVTRDCNKKYTVLTSHCMYWTVSERQLQVVNVWWMFETVK